jgi:uncharacterized protein (TIGR02118 family)
MKVLLSIFAVLLLSTGAMAQTNEKAPVNFKKGMIKVSVIYSNAEGKTFDMDYYLTKHLPFVGGLLGASLKGATVEKGIAGGAPESTAPYAAMGNMYFDSIESFQKAFGPNVDKIMADVKNFTNIAPVIQISEVML